MATWGWKKRWGENFGGRLAGQDVGYVGTGVLVACPKGLTWVFKRMVGCWVSDQNKRWVKAPSVCISQLLSEGLANFLV